MGGRGPICPCPLKCTAQAMQGGLHPSISQGNASNPPAGEGTPLHCRTAQACFPSSHGRCHCSQALPGRRDLLLLSQGRIFQKMCMRWKKSLSGKQKLEETSCGHSGAGRVRDRVGDRGRFAEQKSQRRQRTARAGCETAGDRDFPEEAAQSLLTCRQEPKFTALSAERWEFCSQIINFNICHPSRMNFLSLNSDFFGLNTSDTGSSSDTSRRAQSKGAHGCSSQVGWKGVWCPGWSERESQKSVSSVPPNTCRAAVEFL